MLWVDACSGPGLMLCPMAQKWPSPYSLRSDSSQKGIKNSDNWSLELITTNKQKAVNAGWGLSPTEHKRWGSKGLLDGSTGCGSWDGNGLWNRDLPVRRVSSAIPGFLFSLHTAGPSRTGHLHPASPGALWEHPHDHLAWHRLCL